MVGKCFKKSSGLGISVMCAAIILLSGILSNGFPGLAMAADKTSINCSKEIAKTMVQGTAAGLGETLKGIKAEKDRIDLIRAFISPIRFYPDNSGYFYVYDFNCKNIAHATQKDLQGKNLYDYKDAKGNFAIRNLSNAAKKGGGFVEFYWVKPGSGEQFKKLGYVEPIPGTEYFIGSGVYLP
jgi:signal transduction histidine kinase